MLAGLRITKAAKAKYQIDDSFFKSGLLRFPKGIYLRELVAQINKGRDILNAPHTAVTSGLLSGTIALDAVYRNIAQGYLDKNPDLLDQMTQLKDQAWEESFESVEHAGLDVLFHELSMGNPAARGRLDDLLQLDLDDSELNEVAQNVLLQGPPILGHALPELLEAPQQASPANLSGQIDYVVTHWADLIPAALLEVLLRSRDKLKEENKFGFVGGRPTSEIYTFEGNDPERFSQDGDWMPSCVLIAKNIYVWLYQLSQKYGRQIERLDQIPSEEFEILADRGISGLWMIGLWERSDASRKVKQMCGNQDAVASAYSLYDYKIADGLGGEAAYLELKDAAWKYGVRLAADMVPNHVGIDSDWVRNHPDWFVSLPHSPYNYCFQSDDLCDDPDLSIHVEDGYFDRSDAAVVFKRYDHKSGTERYIYHGNDGTSMPWNDTAQIDYLNPEAREAVIQKILYVAKMFPIIRFDAAMTLVKKHIQRLWYPEPGSGGAIPSRSDYGLTKADFEAAIPKEFWAEVVDRVAKEAPDTLLLAEAFWMLEGYFVRSLGMHRVYNSAFMNMLRDEKNGEYRQLMQNTLEFDPQILKRYVNFMNNPDEDTAVDQFGKDNKYFGICTMMVTLPGLPMLGHGQIEGFGEKYGMDFAKPLLDEVEDAGFVKYHEQRIFPLLHKRRLFAEVENFTLYDLNNADGVDNDVFAYSNQLSDERVLVIYHNRFDETQGWVKQSVGYAVKTGSGTEIQSRNLAAGLSFPAGPTWFVTFRDSVSGLSFVRHVDMLREQGFYVELDAYRCHVFLDWDFSQDPSLHDLNTFLAGRGVESLEDARWDMKHGDLYDSIFAWAQGENTWELTLGETTEFAEQEEPEGVKGEFLRVFRLLSDMPGGLDFFDDTNLRYGLLLLFSSPEIEILRGFLALQEAQELDSEPKIWLKNTDFQNALGIHQFDEKTWVDGTRLEALVALAKLMGRDVTAFAKKITANGHQL